VFEQVSEASRSRVLVEGRRLREPARVGFAAQIVNDLSGAVQASRLVEVSDRVKEHELDAGDLCESGVGLQLAKPDIPIGSREHIRRLVNELDSLPAHDDRPNLLWDDDLKDQGSVDTEVPHERVNPPPRIRSSCPTIFGAEDEIETPLRTE